jgi:hypothetical protein
MVAHWSAALLKSKIAVLTHSSPGLGSECQSEDPMRTMYALTSAAKIIVATPRKSQTPTRAGVTEFLWPLGL